MHRFALGSGNVVSRRFVKFLAVSGVAAAANVISRIVLNRWIPYAPSIVLAYCVGIITAFTLNRLMVFRQTDNPLHHQVMWFVAVNLVAIAQTLGVSLLLARVIFPMAGFHWHADTLAHLIGVGVPAISSYLGHKHFTFRNS